LWCTKKQLAITRKLPDEIIVNADYQRIEQVFTNLFKNAVKYADDGVSIRVSTERCNGRCLVRILTADKWIPPADLEKLFISFYRTDEARGLEAQSYGLAIMRSIIELHGQEFGVRNTPDGVEFWFHLETAAIDVEDETDEI